MDERYRWNEQTRRFEERDRDEDQHRRSQEWRGQDGRSSGGGSDYYGVRSGQGREDNGNRAWEGRGEPFPKDVGGINRPGEERSFGRDPLTGDRGSGRQDERGGQYGQGSSQRGEYRGVQNTQTYGSSSGGYTGQSGTGYGGGSGYGGQGGMGQGGIGQGGAGHSMGGQSYGGQQNFGGQGYGSQGQRSSDYTSRPYGGEQSYGQGYSGGAYGPQRQGGYGAGQGARDFSRSSYGQGGRYVEGGYEEARSTWGRDYDHEREHEARSWWAKARDEFRAWMGDREAERRLQRDHDHNEHYARGGGDWRGHDDDTGWRDPLSAGEQDRGGDWADRSPRHHEAREHRPGWFRDDNDRGRW